VKYTAKQQLIYGKTTVNIHMAIIGSKIGTAANITSSGKD
jgi:hypothetical protein